ncbi:extensin family protein [Parasphingorhabdus halotolerans]|uniref:Extensin family protein n=1 Tax=Parasphingorhabdus halotolerans TaxID=2725558 RepID=A0A6H2DMD0_9SPHN|nr:extensin family protein [Parasphingorhabdus halotolerans]QJB69540.1 extensin family protein [Parasphingorhabdus halotolerans]
MGTTKKGTQPVRTIVMVSILSVALSACGAIPGGRDQSAQRPQSSAGIGAFNPTPSARQCFAELGKANVSFSPLPNRNFGGGCSQIDSITLLDVGTDVTNLGPVKCELASKFAAWTEYAVKRAARQYLGSELARIETMGSYSCRNIAGTGKRSEHAHANAIDISGFVLADGRRITLENNWKSGRKEKQFLAAIHDSACKRFGTVLSPDYNAAHYNHFHFDMGGNGYCR